MTVNAITDTKKGRTGIAPTYLHTTHPLNQYCYKIWHGEGLPGSHPHAKFYRFGLVNVGLRPKK